MLTWIVLIILAVITIIVAEVLLPWLFLSGSDFTESQKKQFIQDMKKYQELQNAMDNGEEIVIRKMTPEEQKKYLKELEIWG